MKLTSSALANADACMHAQVYGHITDAPVQFLGVPISGCLGDQMAALLGALLKVSHRSLATTSTQYM